MPYCGGSDPGALAIAQRLRSITDKDGSPLYNDVRVGVVIDWDGEDENQAY